MSRSRSIFGISVRTFERWCAVGDVPGAYRTKGGHWRVRRPSRQLISRMLATPDYWKIRKWRNVERLFFYFSLRVASPEIKRRLEHLRPLFLQGMTNGKQLNYS